MGDRPAKSAEVTEVAAVIVNYRTPELTMRCIDALSAERRTLPRLRTVVVEGGSNDGSAKALQEVLEQPQYSEWVSFLPLPINGGFGWANNQAILTLARADKPPEFIQLLNPDTEIRPGAVSVLVAELQGNPRCGAAGSQLLNAEDVPTASAFRFPTPGRELINAAHSEKLGRLFGIMPIVAESGTASDVDWVTGASVLLRTETLRQVGLFDDGFFLYFEEVELMHRIRRAGWTVRHVSASSVVHIEGASTGVGRRAVSCRLPSYWYQSRRRYFALTGGRFALFGANLGWLAGRLAGLAKRFLGRPVARDGVRIGDLLSHGLWPRSRDTQPSAPRWGDAPGRPPAWIARP